MRSSRQPTRVYAPVGGQPPPACPPAALQRGVPCSFFTLRQLTHRMAAQAAQRLHRSYSSDAAPAQQSDAPERRTPSAPRQTLPVLQEAPLGARLDRALARKAQIVQLQQRCQSHDGGGLQVHHRDQVAAKAARSRRGSCRLSSSSDSDSSYTGSSNSSSSSSSSSDEVEAATTCNLPPGALEAVRARRVRRHWAAAVIQAARRGRCCRKHAAGQRRAAAAAATLTARWLSRTLAAWQRWARVRGALRARLKRWCARSSGGHGRRRRLLVPLLLADTLAAEGGKGALAAAHHARALAMHTLMAWVEAVTPSAGIFNAPLLIGCSPFTVAYLPPPRHAPQ
jgi:hypothetical protein